MSVYFLARIQIHDPHEYQLYLEDAGKVFSKFKGEYLAVDDLPVKLEGSPGPGRAVLIRFPNKEDFEAWYHSVEYQEILKHRLHGAYCHTLLIRGKE